jgi:hypothetical protein
MDAMTGDQYTELIVFLGRKFGRIEGKLEAHDREFVEVRRHATVLFEQARAERRIMMEGINARFDRIDETLVDHERRLEAP